MYAELDPYETHQFSCKNAIHDRLLPGVIDVSAQFYIYFMYFVQTMIALGYSLFISSFFALGNEDIWCSRIEGCDGNVWLLWRPN